MKRSLSTSLFFALAASCLSASSAVAAQSAVSQDATKSPLYFPNADKNHNGVLTRSEVPKELHELRSHFDQYDANHDHELSEAEYVGYLSSLGSGACRDDVHTSEKCAISPYSADPQRIGDAIMSGQTPRDPGMVNPPKSGG
jgi:hypothetical protein